MKNAILLFVLFAAIAPAQESPAAPQQLPAQQSAPEPVTLSDLEKLERRYREQLVEQQKALDEVTREIQRLKSERLNLESYKQMQEAKDARQVDFNWTKISERIDKAAAYYDLAWQFTENAAPVLEISDGMLRALNALASQESPITEDRLNKAMDYLEHEARRRKKLEVAGVMAQGAVNVLKLDLGINLMQQMKGKTDQYRDSYKTLLCLKEFTMKQGANRSLFRSQLTVLDEQRTRTLKSVDDLNGKLRDLVTPQGITKNITAAEFRARAKDYFLSLKPPKNDVVVANAPWSYAEGRLEACWTLLRESQRTIRQHLAFIEALEAFAANNAEYLQEFKKPCSIDPTVRYEVGASIGEFEKARQGFAAAKGRIQKSAPVQVLLDL